MKIYCCGCQAEVDARLTSGKEIYPHRKDLYKLPFWKCDACENYVGCHHKTQQKTKPLGNIPTSEIRDVRRKIHVALDALWKSGCMKRGAVYGKLSAALGYTYHTSEIKTIEEANRVFAAVHKLAEEGYTSNVS